jgi:hypothetical protein
MNVHSLIGTTLLSHVSGTAAAAAGIRKRSK